MKKLMLVLGLISLNVVASEDKSFVNIYTSYAKQRNADAKKKFGNSLTGPQVAMQIAVQCANLAFSNAPQAMSTQEYQTKVALVNRANTISETITE